MKYTKTISLFALLSATNAWGATTTPYYEYEVLSVDTGDSNYGAFPSAISEDSTLVGAFALKSALDVDVDSGLPYTFNQACFFDDEICELRYYGSEDSSDLSYENAYQDWRINAADIDQGELTPESYFYGATSEGEVIGFGDDTDVKVTDVVSSDIGDFTVGYGSGEYTDAERDFVRRAFITPAGNSDADISLIPTAFDDDQGGFSSAYRMRDVTYVNGTSKTLIVGNASKSLAGGDSDYFDLCYNEGDEQTSAIFDLNYLVNCPGFDTQAWAWEYTGSETEIEGFALATEWLDDNEERDSSSDVTYSAAAFDINSSGIAVGVSSFELNDDDEGARQRAIFMTPSDDGEYGVPTEITEATDDIDDQEDSIYNTWAKTITDDTNVVMGNRQYAVSKNVNRPIEMFVYDIDEDSITFPLLNKKVLSTRQRLAGDSATYVGANSQGYDMNNNGLIVGKADAYDQINPVVSSSARSQSAFLYDNTTDDSWFIEDLLCSADEDGVVTHPLIKLQSARAINDDGVVLAEGYQYDSISDYQLNQNPTSIMVKLTPDLESEPDESPNCWESEALADTDVSFTRSGAASFWLWIFALPLLLIRRIVKFKNK